MEAFNWRLAYGFRGLVYDRHGCAWLRLGAGAVAKSLYPISRQQREHETGAGVGF